MEVQEDILKVQEDIPADLWTGVGIGAPDGDSDNFILRCQRHEFVQKLIVRMQKYKKRGIRFIDPPARAFKYRTTYPCMMSGELELGPSLPGSSCEASSAEESDGE